MEEEVLRCVINAATNHRLVVLGVSQFQSCNPPPGPPLRVGCWCGHLFKWLLQASLELGTASSVKLVLVSAVDRPPLLLL